MTPIGLDDLPEEILHEIAAYLLHPDQYPPIDFPEAYPGVLLPDDRFKRCKTPQGKDVMSLASCGKWMRSILFGRWLMEFLSVKLCEEDLRMVESLMQDTRDCVRNLRISPGDQDPHESDALFSYIDLIRPFGNIQTLDIAWTPLAETDPRLEGLKAAARAVNLDSQTNRNANHPAQSRLIKLDISSTDTHKPSVPDRAKFEQLGHLLKQLRFPRLQRFNLEIGSAAGLHTHQAAADWASLARVLEECRFPDLRTFRLKIVQLCMNGQEIGVDFCDTLSDVFETCFSGPFIESIDIVLAFTGVPGDSYALYTPVAYNNAGGIASPAWISPPLTMQAFVESVSETRSHLDHLSLYMEWSIKPSDEDPANHGVGMWLLEYPFGSISDGYTSDDDEAKEEGMEVSFLRVDEAYVKVSVHRRGIHAYCPPPFHAHEVDEDDDEAWETLSDSEGDASSEMSSSE